jgi:hypothetical protein
MSCFFIIVIAVVVVVDDTYEINEIISAAIKFNTGCPIPIAMIG